MAEGWGGGGSKFWLTKHESLKVFVEEHTGPINFLIEANYFLLVPLLAQRVLANA